VQRNVCENNLQLVLEIDCSDFNLEGILSWTEVVALFDLIEADIVTLKS
jgi:hypothetical protein